MSTRKHYTAKDDFFLKQNYHRLTRNQMARALGRSTYSISNRLHNLGLKLSDEQRMARCKEHGFKPGHRPHNKYVKGYYKANVTSFKPGHLPHNTKEDGCISVRAKEGEKPYKYIRVELGKWKLLHRHVWEQANGPIPKGCVVAFKDGDTMNCELNNLELLSMKENMIRNQNREKQKESMKATWSRVKAFEKYGIQPQGIKLKSKRK